MCMGIKQVAGKNPRSAAGVQYLFPWLGLDEVYKDLSFEGLHQLADGGFKPLIVLVRPIVEMLFFFHLVRAPGQLAGGLLNQFDQNAAGILGV